MHYKPKTHKCLLAIIVTLLYGGTVTYSVAQQNLKTANPFPANAWGVYTWVGDATKINPSDYPYMKGAPLIMGWKSLEPQNGVYRFDQVIGRALRHMVKYNYYTCLNVFYTPDGFTPAWIFENGNVPKVTFPPRKNPFRQMIQPGFPYFFDKNYIHYYYRFISEFAKYIKSLPKELQDRILFIQASEGSTGDPQGYKVQPLDPKYKYTPEQWETFRMNAWREYIKDFSDDKGHLIKPICVNEPADTKAENKWLIANMPGNIIVLKEGTFSHGYDLSETNDRVRKYEEFRKELAGQGKMLFSRGEYDAEWRVVGWSTINPAQAIYWSSIFALYCGLDMWNISTDAAKGDRFAAAFKMFNKYAGQHNPATAVGAFCALRQGLDAADTQKFPEQTFGKAIRTDTNRYINIAKAFASHGAMQGDAKKAAGGFMANRQADRYNDVTWDTPPGNYEIFLHQINADATSVGWWHVGPASDIYGHFARGFDHDAGKKIMYFKLDPQFFADHNAAHKIKLRIVYLDKGTGKWSINYNQGNKGKSAVSVTCGNTGKWLEKQITADALFNQGLAEGADITLNYEGGDDTIFHLIEITR